MNLHAHITSVIFQNDCYSIAVKKQSFIFTPLEASAIAHIVLVSVAPAETSRAERECKL